MYETKNLTLWAENW